MTKLYQFGDLKTIPNSLNISNIIKTTDGTIDTSNRAIAEIKDFIASRDSVSGQDIQLHFDRDPYGWSKDTTRYIVALMLKASMIQLRVGGKTVDVFGDTAVDALGSNNSFGKSSFSLAAGNVLTVQELLAAAQNLIALFNGKSIAPLKDEIAKEALAKIKPYLPKFNSLDNDFTQLKLEGLATLKKAISYANRIVESDGGDAAALLGKDSSCVDAFKFVVNFMKIDSQSSLLDNLKHVSKQLSDIDSIRPILQLPNFNKQMDDAAQVYSEIIAKPDIHLSASEVMDLKAQVETYLAQACIEFQTRSNAQLNKTREDIRSMPEYAILSDAHRAQIDALLDELVIEIAENNSRELGEKAKAFASYYLPSGAIDSIKLCIQGYLTDEQTSQSAEQPNQTAAESTKIYSAKNVSVKRKITSKQDLKNLIDQLSQCLNIVSEERPVELTIEE